MGRKPTGLVEMPEDLFWLVEALAREVDRPVQDMLVITLLNGLSYIAAVGPVSAVLTQRIKDAALSCTVDADREWHTPDQVRRNAMIEVWHGLKAWAKRDD